MTQEVLILEPADRPRVRLRDVAMPALRRGDVLVEQSASSINPIDAKRASGYGRRLLSLKGAGRFPIVLGNDVVGVVKASGPGSPSLPIGTVVYGVLPTGRRGAHAEHVAIDARWLRVAPPGADAKRLAALPYCFCTAWLALRGAGLTPQTARGRRVLISGASGGLGHIAIHLLQTWGAQITAAPRSPAAMKELPSDFAAVLNFADWNNDAVLTERLAYDSLGHATTVHPLLGNFDNQGWLRGALNSLTQIRASRARVEARSPGARYAWTVFKPTEEALDELAAQVASGLNLPNGWVGTIERAQAGFDHVRAGRSGRAVLLFP